MLRLVEFGTVKLDLVSESEEGRESGDVKVMKRMGRLRPNENRI